MSLLLQALAGDSEIGALLADEAQLAAMLQFEAALAAAEARAGLITQAAAAAIATGIARFVSDPIVTFGTRLAALPDRSGSSAPTWPCWRRVKLPRSNSVKLVRHP